MIYTFERNQYTLEEVNDLTPTECSKLLNDGKCDALETVDDLIWHINNDCLPPLETLYLKQC